MAAHKYWRLNISAVDGAGSRVIVHTLNLFDTSGGSDLAVSANGSASASTTVNGSNAASNTIDEDIVSKWTSAGSSLPEWLKFTFTTSADIVEYQVGGGTSGFLDESPSAWTFEYSDDDTNWTIASTESGQTGWSHGEIRTFSAAVSIQSVTAISINSDLSISINPNPNLTLSTAININSSLQIAPVQAIVIPLSTAINIRSGLQIFRVIKKPQVATIKITCKITGAGDNLPDLIIPISSFTGTNVSFVTSHIAVVCPNGKDFGVDIGDRSHGGLILTTTETFFDGTKNIVNSEEYSINQIFSDRGASAWSIRVRGTFTSFTPHLPVLQTTDNAVGN